MKKTVRWKNIAVAGLVAAALMVCSICAYAINPGVREFIKLIFLMQDSVQRLDTVPEGWIGVYTVEDLEGIRDNLGGKYILMNDLRIPDEMYETGGLYVNGFSPIGPGDPSKAETADSFTGVFNGNGYVISNVHIRVTEPILYVGLFGQCRMDMTQNENVLETGIIKNLGIRDSSVAVEKASGRNMHIGMIAGESAIIAGCFTENVSVSYCPPEVSSETGLAEVRIGGVVGAASIVDSCWSDADVTAKNPENAENRQIYAAGVCGYAATCVTSYFNGTVTTDTEDWGVAYCEQNGLPMIMTEALLREIPYRILKAEGFAEEQLQNMSTEELTGYLVNQSYPSTEAMHHWTFVYTWFTSFYFQYWVSDVEWLPSYMQSYLTVDVRATKPEGEEAKPVYVRVRDMNVRELEMGGAFLDELFTPEEFSALCRENGIKYGAYDNYDLRNTTDCTFEGFDFQNIWVLNEENQPILRLFETNAG